MRTVPVWCAALSLVLAGCASAPTAGPLGEGFDFHPAITSVDTARPPHFAWTDLDKQSYVALLLVTPGRGVTMLYPRDSIVDNRLSAGAHELTFLLTSPRVVADSLNRLRRRTPQRADTLRSVAEQRGSMGPAQISTTYLLLVVSPQQLSYARIHEKTQGVSIPLDEMEALNAVSKAVKSTLVTEPREWAAFYRQVALTPDR